MILGFYYHVPVSKYKDDIMFPGYLGVFIDSLASAVENLTLFLHQANEHEQKELNYTLKAKNINWINMGLRDPAWKRSLFNKKNLNPFKEEFKKCDYILVRGPSPLAPYFHKYIKREKIIFMVVGDYKEGAKNFVINNFRDYIITWYLRLNDFFFEREIKKTKIVVNSGGLYRRYKDIAKHIDRIRTTTLSKGDFYYKENQNLNEVIELLYTGRIDSAKGLFELIDATSLLIQNGLKCRLNIVGWEIKEGKTIENQLRLHAAKNKIENDVIFHGKKSFGEELNEMYRMADIYIIPSYHEGFPRTIWEAMANSIPVITTAVGGIPDELTHEVNALFVSPKNVTEIKEAVERMVQNKSLRETIIKNGQKKAESNTLETQTKLLIAIIEKG
jgi:glycosyltransferase involved in cell wall biosynthesis